MSESRRTILSYLKNKNSPYGPYTWQSVSGEVKVQWLPDEGRGWIDIENPKGVKGASGFRKLMRSVLPKLDILAAIPAEWEWNPDDVKKGGIYEYLGPKMKGSFTPNPNMPNKAAIWDTRPKSKGTIMSVKPAPGSTGQGQPNNPKIQQLNKVFNEVDDKIELGTKMDPKAEVINIRREIASQLEAARDLHGIDNIEGNKNILSKLRSKLKNLPSSLKVSNVNKLFRALRKGINISDIPLSDLPTIKSENSKTTNTLTDKEIRKWKSTGVIDGEFSHGPILRWGKRITDEGKWGVDLQGTKRSIEGFVKWLNKSYSDAQLRAKLEGTRPWRGEQHAGHGRSVEQFGSHAPSNLAPQPARKVVQDLIGNLDIKGKSLHTLEDLQRAGVDGGTLLGAFQEYMNEGAENILRFADLPMRDRSVILHGVDLDGNALNSEALSIAARRKLDDRAGELFIKRANPDLPEGRTRMQKFLEPSPNPEIVAVDRPILKGKGLQNIFTKEKFRAGRRALYETAQNATKLVEPLKPIAKVAKPIAKATVAGKIVFGGLDVKAAVTGTGEVLDEEADVVEKLAGGLEAISGATGVASLFPGPQALVTAPVSVATGLGSAALRYKEDIPEGYGLKPGSKGMYTRVLPSSLGDPF